MNNKALEDIKNYAVKRLNQEYGYCGCAEGDNAAMINSDDKSGNDIKIIIKLEPED